ncbi:Amidohydrolase [compost metagenome]
MNPDNLIFGTDFPFNHCFDQETPLKEMHGLALPDAARRRILGGAAAALLGFEGDRPAG